MTGKPLGFGGSLIRPEATGYGLVYYIRKKCLKQTVKVLTERPLSYPVLKCSSVCCAKATALGAKVISVSDSNGYIIDKDGIDFDLLVDVKEKRRARLTEYAAERASATYHEGSVWTYEGALTLPCHVPLKNEIDGEAAKRLVAQGVFCIRRCYAK